MSKDLSGIVTRILDNMNEETRGLKGNEFVMVCTAVSEIVMVTVRSVISDAIEGHWKNPSAGLIGQPTRPDSREES